MLYTVKEMAELSGVTIKTLHYYHKIGLLIPHEISEAGYRLYSQAEVERLQQILQTVRRDPSRSESKLFDLNELVRDMHQAWAESGRCLHSDHST